MMRMLLERFPAKRVAHVWLMCFWRYPLFRNLAIVVGAGWAGMSPGNTILENGGRAGYFSTILLYTAAASRQNQPTNT